jgi:hypothetical protein
MNIRMTRFPNFRELVDCLLWAVFYYLSMRFLGLFCPRYLKYIKLVHSFRQKLVRPHFARFSDKLIWPPPYQQTLPINILSNYICKFFLISTYVFNGEVISFFFLRWPVIPFPAVFLPQTVCRKLGLLGIAIVIRTTEPVPTSDYLDQYSYL